VDYGSDPEKRHKRMTVYACLFDWCLTACQHFNNTVMRIIVFFLFGHNMKHILFITNCDCIILITDWNYFIRQSNFKIMFLQRRRTTYRNIRRSIARESSAFFIMQTRYDELIHQFQCFHNGSPYRALNITERICKQKNKVEVSQTMQHGTHL
jgi:hypothetical protein